MTVRAQAAVTVVSAPHPHEAVSARPAPSRLQHQSQPDAAAHVYAAGRLVGTHDVSAAAAAAAASLA
eukprot:CAMPEP_0183355150 /NCGR_PEP_ID=MMETSP0164_2-20130417/39356_1 /TAXON_ID=221442 /ORGANISM="Coccolithus pelagicus ssp braarudi, Strain PLY182g" /LENGTH=66 /DNA_ID=CAMNT_0025528175 /DNA_START=514 /DNA_END=714 /DNA_ORIENTATION=-